MTGLIVVLVGILGFNLYTFKKVNAIPKVCVVDNAVLLSQFSEGISARKNLEYEKKKWEMNVKTLEDSVKKAFEYMKNNYDKSNDKKRAEMQKNLHRWNEEFNNYTKAVDNMSRKKEEELLKPVIEQLNSFVKIWAKRNGYPIVIGTGNGGVILSAADYVNVTDQILEELNKHYGKTAADIPDMKDELNDTISKNK